MLDHFGILAPFYERFIPPPSPDRLLELLGLPIQGRLLDVGGGTGRVSALLRPYVDQVLISDVSEPMVRRAQAKGELHTLLARAEKLPFPDDSFDRVLVVDALHHFQDQRSAIANLVRILKPGGRLVIEEPDLRRLAVKMVSFAEKIMLMRSHFYYPHEIDRLVSEQGVHSQVVTDGHFAAWVVATK